ncbi:hypothetical protein [Metaclostridioides mangenotii]|uniref:hypothetical protein n=1 Tax=Metaclostridioides mangenotii TaxID=1540 RepID=UPI00057187C7|nr:hypothetical protein [Clostridioides mangenotii]
MRANSLQNNQNLIINKGLYTLTLFIILLRKYMITILKADSAALKVVPILFYGSIILLFIQFIIRKDHNKTEVILFLISCALYVFTREGSILVLILLAISVRDIEDKYVVKSYFLMSLVFIIVCMVMSNFLPFLTQIEESHYRLVRGAYVIRETFGFGNPNSVFLFSLPIYAAYIFLRFDKYNMYDRILLIAMTAFIYLQTMSRTGALTVIGALIFVDILRVVDLKKFPIISLGIKILPILFLGISLTIGTVLSKINIFNEILASRPLHWHAYLVEYGSIFTLFGNKYDEIVKVAHPLDSSYIYILSLLGIVTLVFFLFLLYRGLSIFIENDQKKYIAVVIIFLIYAFAENILIEAGYNFTIILLIKYVINNDNGRFTFKEMLKRK